MALDRFIYFDMPGQVAPSREDVSRAMEAYLDKARYCHSTRGRRITVTLEGEASSPTRELNRDQPRFFEIFCDEDNIDVITRQADEYTNAVAEGFAALVARLFNGRREE